MSVVGPTKYRFCYRKRRGKWAAGWRQAILAFFSLNRAHFEADPAVI